MSVTDVLPRQYPFTYEEGDHHIGVWAIQHAVGATRDGAFGPQTLATVQDFQDRHGLVPDGVVGAKTMEQLVRSQCAGAYRTHAVPPGSLESVSKGEAGWNVGAVNWASPGGVDVGAFQRRVYEPHTREAIERALRVNYQARLLAGRLRERKDAFYARGFLSHERGWRCAVLAHNWPYGADRISRGFELSDRVAEWVPGTLTFDDGARVVTYKDWADWYSMGSSQHNHDGKMVSLVSGWPR